MPPTLLHVLPWIAALLALAACAAEDLRTRMIPDHYVAVIALCGMFAASTHGVPHLAGVLAAALCTALALGVLAHYGVIGGGDVKLIAALALLVPPGSVPLLLAEIALAGGVLSGLYLAGGMVLRRQPALYRRPAGRASGGPWRKWLRREGSRMARSFPLPYGLAVLGGAACHFMRELQLCYSGTFCSL